jgi:putative copper resistance protein D
MIGDLATEFWLIAARAIQFASCLLILSVFVFDRLVVGDDLRQSNFVALFWRKIYARLLLIAVPLAIISGAVWFVWVTMGINDLPFQLAIQPNILLRVWTHTQFGRLWQWRLICWVATTLAVVLIPRKSGVTWLAMALAVVLLGSLTWSGHGRNGEMPQWHLLADGLHLIIAAAWPTGLLPFGLVIFCIRKSSDPDQHSAMIKLTRRFSATSLISVAILAGTGIVNSCHLLQSISSLFATSYGHVLLTKIVLFLVMVALGAFNLFRLKPRIGIDAEAAAKLQLTVTAEFICGVVVVIVVALLGTLPPG